MATLKIEKINEVIDFLKRNNFKNVEDTAIKFNNQFHCYDVYADYGNSNIYKCGFEVKHRLFESTKYGDMIIELHKFNNIAKKIIDGEIDCCYLITIFNDKSYIQRIDNNFELVNSFGSKTTFFENQEKVDKLYCSWKITDATKEIKL